MMREWKYAMKKDGRREKEANNFFSSSKIHLINCYYYNLFVGDFVAFRCGFVSLRARFVPMILDSKILFLFLYIVLNVILFSKASHHFYFIFFFYFMCRARQQLLGIERKEKKL